MKTTSPKNLAMLACLGLAVTLSGCACGSYSLNPFKGQPVRTKVRSWFQGDACSTCNPPVGRRFQFGSNVAPTCTSCGSIVDSNMGSSDPGVSLYSETSLNGPTLAPFEQGIPGPMIQNGNSLSEIENAFGTGVVNDGVIPPNF